MHVRCPHCHNPIEIADIPSSGEIACAGCGSSFQLASMATATFEQLGGQRNAETVTYARTQPASNPSGGIPEIAGYEIRSLLGRGGMGVVYQARHMKLDRVVALKMLLLGPQATPSDLARFRGEGEAIAKFQHPHIVQIFEVGEHDGMPFISLEYCPEGSLAKRMNGTPLSDHVAAAVVEMLARAIFAAHEKGILHRDLKPANVLLSPLRSGGEGTGVMGLGVPKIADFGLAKNFDPAVGELVTGPCPNSQPPKNLPLAGEIMTLARAAVGTPSYMAPEQATADKPIGPPCDIYALGAVLYECLTGRPPFRAATVIDTLAQVINDEPVPPRQLQSKVARDLETICLKCLSKAPAARYGTAQDLADDLRRFQAGEPIVARPVGSVERAWRWCKRKPAFAAANAAFVALFVTFVVGFFAVNDLRKQEQIERGKAEEQSKANKKLAEENKKLAEDSDERRERAEELALRVGFNDFYYRSKESLGLAFAGAAQLLPKTSLLTKSELSDSIRIHLSGWAPNIHPLRGIGMHDGSVRRVAQSADGKIVISGSKDNTARLWNANTGEQIVIPLQHGKEVMAVALTPDGKIAMTGSADNTARLWDTATGNPVTPPLKHGLPVHAVALSVDGRKAITGSFEKSARVWDAATGKQIGATLRHNEMVMCVALSADGSIAITGSLDTTSRLWNTSTGEQIGPSLQHAAPVYAVDLSGDGKIAITGSRDKTARLWNTATGAQIHQPLIHQLGVHSVALSSDGKIALTAGRENVARLWDTATGKQTGAPLRHVHEITSVVISGDGQTALTSSYDKTAKLWDTLTGEQIGAPFHHRAKVNSVAISTNGKSMVTGSDDGSVRFWEESSGTAIDPLSKVTRSGHLVALSANGRICMTGGRLNAQIWDVRTGAAIGPEIQHSRIVNSLALSADGKVAVTGSDDRTARLCDATLKKNQTPTLQHPAEVLAVALSADGAIALTGSADKWARLWDVSTGKPISQFENASGFLRRQSLALSANGAVALTANADKVVRLWNTSTGKLIGKSLVFSDFVRSVALTADGRTALIACDRIARLWDPTTGMAIGPDLEHLGEIRSVALSPDGRFALTGSNDKTAVLWEAFTGKIIGASLGHSDIVQSLAVSADGKVIFTSDGIAQFWKFPHLNHDSERIKFWAQVITGMEVDEQLAIRVLDAKTWRERRAQLEKLGGPPIE